MARNNAGCVSMEFSGTIDKWVATATGKHSKILDGDVLFAMDRNRPSPAQIGRVPLPAPLSLM